MGRTEPELANPFSCHTQLQLAMVLRPQWKQILSKFSNLLSRQFAAHHHFNWKLATCQTYTLDTSNLHCRVCRLALFSMLASLARKCKQALWRIQASIERSAEPELANTYSCHTQLQLAMVLRPQWKQILSNSVICCQGNLLHTIISIGNLQLARHTFTF